MIGVRLVASDKGRYSFPYGCDDLAVDANRGIQHPLDNGAHYLALLGKLPL